VERYCYLFANGAVFRDERQDAAFDRAQPSVKAVGIPHRSRDDAAAPTAEFDAR
jgi:hypothetical protein